MIRMLYGLLGLIGIGAATASHVYEVRNHRPNTEIASVKTSKEMGIKYQKKLLSSPLNDVQKPITWNQRKERKWLRQNPHMRSSKKAKR